MKTSLKSLLILGALVSWWFIPLAFASDNYVDLQGYADGKSPRIKSTETGGVHVPHVIVDSGGGGSGDGLTDTQLRATAVPVTLTSSTVTAYTPFAIASVTTSSTTVLAANTSRLSAIICNNGATDIYLRLGTPAVANQSILLKANGGSYTIGSTNLYRGIITAVTASGTGVLCGTEGI